MKGKFFIAILFILMQLPHASAQVVSFSQLNTSNGLSDNYIQSLSIDKSGFLWIGTSDGLNMYDGYSITSWFKGLQTGLQSDTIRQLYCDSKNNIWLATPGSVSWIDHEKQFHQVILPGNKEKFSCYVFFETCSYGMILFTADGQYFFDNKKQQWERIDWLSQIVNVKGFNTAMYFTNDKGIYVYEDEIIMVDYKIRKVVFRKNIPGAVTACKYNDESIAAATRNGDVHIINVNNQQELATYHVYNETDGKRSSPRISEMAKASDGSLVIATLLKGLVRIDSTSGAVSAFQHDPLNTASISSNLLFRVFAAENGDVVTGSVTSGVGIYNCNSKKAIYKKIFRNTKGNVFDGAVNEMAEDKNGSLWVCAVDRLICWDRSNNISRFYQYFYNDPALGSRNLEMRTICIDKKDRIWVGAIGAGLALFNKNTGKFQLISKDTSLASAVKNNYVNHIIEDSDGKIWACSYGGMYMIDPDTYHITTFTDHPVLKEVAEKIVISLYEDNVKRIWIGTQRFGIYCYDKTKQTLVNYTTANGLLNNTGNALTGDQWGNVYTSHLNGFSVVDAAGAVRNFSKANGMRYPRCEGIVADNNGNVWIANNKCLIRYLPANHRLEYFEENAGISKDGFRFDAVYKTKDSSLYFGTHRGLNYFNPLKLKNYTAQLRVNIYQVSLPDSVLRFSNSPTLNTTFAKNSIQFHFTAINLTGSRNIAYEYILEGYDKEWQKGNDIHFARYTSLPSGNYKFKVKASIDRINWVNADNEVSIRITPPFWKQWWVITACIILFLVIIIVIVQFRINRIRYKEKLKTIYNKRISETEMKALRAQMNPHFIFNSLNSINKYILKSDHTNASRYLTRFAKLIRLILDNSNSKEVTLSNELEALRLYIEMEALRFTNKFSWEIKVDENVSADTLQVPPMIIQPYVENAIWHGLLHKESDGNLLVSVRKADEHMLKCIIEDNGIGRNKAKELKSKSATANKSLGMKLTEERIHMLNQYASLNASIEIIDLENDKGEAKGTKVIITIPI